MKPPRNQRLGLNKSEINALNKALAIARKAIAERPSSPTAEQFSIIDKACDARNALEGLITLETGVKA